MERSPNGRTPSRTVIELSQSNSPMASPSAIRKTTSTGSTSSSSSPVNTPQMTAIVATPNSTGSVIEHTWQPVSPSESPKVGHKGRAATSLSLRGSPGHNRSGSLDLSPSPALSPRESRAKSPREKKESERDESPSPVTQLKQKMKELLNPLHYHRTEKHQSADPNLSLGSSREESPSKAEKRKGVQFDHSPVAFALPSSPPTSPPTSPPVIIKNNNNENNGDVTFRERTRSNSASAVEKKEKKAKEKEKEKEKEREKERKERPSLFSRFEPDTTPISDATRAKSNTMKHFMFQYYWGLYEYIRQREERLQEMEDRIINGKMTFMESLAEKNAFYKKETNDLRSRRNRVAMSDFQTLARIGKGGFGNVFLVRYKKSGQVYALKRMNRLSIRNKNKIVHIQTEKEILELTSETENPWLVQLYFAFQDVENLYLAMEYAPGGDFRSLLANIGGFSENEAKIYLAEMVTAVGHLHTMGFTHRDLKPDNFLIDREGHIKLADFGLSKGGLKELYRSTIGFAMSPLKAVRSDQSDWKRRTQTFIRKRELAYSVVGSPDYMAYELLMGKGYDERVDWWSLGVIFFEMVAGVPPFFADTPEEVFANINEFQKVLEELEHTLAEEEGGNLSPPGWTFLKKLLCDPDQRIGKLGYKEILQNEYFSGVPIDDLKTLKPPFVPQLESEHDLSYFDSEVCAQLAEEPVSREMSALMAGNMNDHALQGFTFRRPTKSASANPRL
eukprot:TRINITY_DN11564_c0_g1_i1.p1 TRINITY_DN11564_c0_g1~~TRINITY_DN11564_c0_g1_i1.p1  ORF type:complete len:731 (+),score=239.96 TRINITY_DN11564_c0_g1_i1:286-2478(+)